MEEVPLLPLLLVVLLHPGSKVLQGLVAVRNYSLQAILLLLLQLPG
jgi:hypothetical protein